MNKFVKALAATSAVATLGFGASAAHAADATATATAEILQQVAVSQVSDLNFGSIVPSTTANTTVSVSADAAATRNCGGLVCSDAASVTSASFNVTGAAGLAVNVTGLTGLTQLSSGGNNMTIALNGSTLDMSTGSDVLYVGGDLTVGANQAAGTYTGSFTVSVNYQ